MPNSSPNNLDQCLKCTVCTAVCPVAAVNPDYAGPKSVGPDGERYRLKSAAFFQPEMLKLCLNCKRCEVACPHDVRIGDMILKARRRVKSRHPLRDAVLSNTDLVGRVASALAPVVNATLRQPLARQAMHTLLCVDKRRTMPSYAGTTFERWFRREMEEKQAAFPDERTVNYFHGCYVNYNYPQLGRDLVGVLNALGIGVRLLKKEACCGVALMANGMMRQATRQARRNVASLRRSGKRPTLCTSSSCTFNLRDEYPHVLAVDNADVRPDITLATRYLYRLIEQGEVRLAFRPDYRRRVAYHTACHMERLGWAVYSVGLLRMIPGLELVKLESQCCGMAGTYGFKRENYATSQAVGAPLFRQIEASEAGCVATDCETCKWQIEMNTSLPVMNPVSLLAEALDLEATYRLNNPQRPTE